MASNDDADEASDRGNQSSYSRQVSQEDVGQQATLLLQRFIAERFQRDCVPNAPTVEDIRGGERPSPHEDQVWVEVGSLIRDMADALDRDQELQRWIESVPDDSSIDTIIAVAHAIFSDGEINWGRIVGLFYFAYQMCARAIGRFMEENFPSWVNELIRAVVKFLLIKFADWIIKRGGWMAIREYLGTSNHVWGTLVVVSAIALLFGLYKLK